MFNKAEFYNLFEREHYYCEDTGYSCPMHPEGCVNDEEENCNCGANKHNISLIFVSEAIETEISDLCNALCGVLDQSYSGFSEEDDGVYRTQYNYDAIAVDLLQKHGYVEIIEGEWPQTKYLVFKFTKKRAEWKYTLNKKSGEWKYYSIG